MGLEWSRDGAVGGVRLGVFRMARASGRADHDHEVRRSRMPSPAGGNSVFELVADGKEDRLRLLGRPSRRAKVWWIVEIGTGETRVRHEVRQDADGRRRGDDTHVYVLCCAMNASATMNPSTLVDLDGGA